MKNEMTVNLAHTALFLARFASIVKHPRFHLLLTDPINSRVKAGTHELQAKLLSSLLTQINYLLPTEAKHLPLQQKLLLLSNEAMSSSDKLSATMSVKIFKKDYQRFPTRTQNQFNARVFEFLSIPDHSHIIKDDHFYLWNAISSMIIHIRALHTLTDDTGSQYFEHILSSVSDSYLINGYPCDLLSHDAHNVRMGTPFLTIAMKKDYCSTFMIFTTSEYMQLDLSSYKCIKPVIRKSA